MTTAYEIPAWVLSANDSLLIWGCVLSAICCGMRPELTTEAAGVIAAALTVNAWLAARASIVRRRAESCALGTDGVSAGLLLVIEITTFSAPETIHNTPPETSTR